MARSRQRKRVQTQPTPPKRRPWHWRRSAAGWAEFSRNVALLFVAAPLIEPLIHGGGPIGERAGVGIVAALVLLAVASIFDQERSD